MMKSLKNFAVWYLVVSVFFLGFTSKATAGMAPSTPVVLTSWDRNADLDKIQKTLETKIICQRLYELGFSQEEIRSRLTRMSDQQIHEIALRLDTLKVGGDGIGLVVGILVIAILVWVIVYLYGGHKIIVK